MRGRIRWTTRRAHSRAKPRLFTTIRWRATATPARISARSSARRILYLLPFGTRPALWRQRFAADGLADRRLADQRDRSGAVGTPVDLSTGQDAPGNRPDLLSSHQVSEEHHRHGSIRPRSPILPRLRVSVSNATTYTRLEPWAATRSIGPGYRVVNFSLQKNLHLTEKYTLELHGDAFNLFNTAEFTNPNSNLTGGNFGQIEGVQVYSNREIQLAARFTF